MLNITMSDSLKNSITIKIPLYIYRSQSKQLNIFFTKERRLKLTQLSAREKFVGQPSQKNIFKWKQSEWQIWIRFDHSHSKMLLF